MLAAYVHISTASTVTVGGASSQTQLVAVNVNTGAAGTLTISDATTNAVIAVIDTTTKGSFWYGKIRVAGGIKIVNSATADCTVSFI